MAMSVVSLSEFKANAPWMLAQLKASDGVIVITQNGSPSAVVEDYESHQEQRATLQALKVIAQGEADVSAGRTVPQRRVFADIRAGLANGDNRPARSTSQT